MGRVVASGIWDVAFDCVEICELTASARDDSARDTLLFAKSPVRTAPSKVVLKFEPTTTGAEDVSDA